MGSTENGDTGTRNNLLLRPFSIDTYEEEEVDTYEEELCTDGDIHFAFSSTLRIKQLL